MRRMTLLLGAIFGLGGALAWWVGCGDDSGSLSASERQDLCQKSCAKEVECGKESDQAKCESDCNRVTEHMISGYVKDSVACETSHTCDELDQGVCDEAGKDKCTSDDSVLASAYCDKAVACGKAPSKDQCMQAYQAQTQTESFWHVKCFLQSDLGKFADCIGTANCASLDEDMHDCAVKYLGAEPQ